MSLAGSVRAQQNYYKFHALFIYNFTKHIQWPNVGSSLRVGVFGSESAINVLKANISNRKYGDKPIEIVKVSNSTEAARCNILYAPKSNKTKITELLENSTGRSILTVTEDDLIDMGACISFIIKGARLNFKINKQRIESEGMKVSAALISLGELVE
jgi:hypothetical protein